jgi:hypothetical protein
MQLEKDLRTLKWPNEKDEFPLMAKLVKVRRILNMTK